MFLLLVYIKPYYDRLSGRGDILVPTMLFLIKTAFIGKKFSFNYYVLSLNVDTGLMAVNNVLHIFLGE